MHEVVREVIMPCLICDKKLVVDVAWWSRYKEPAAVCIDCLVCPWQLMRTVYLLRCRMTSLEMMVAREFQKTFTALEDIENALPAFGERH